MIKIYYLEIVLHVNRMFYIISCDKYVCEKSVHEKKGTFLRFFLKGDKYVWVLYIKLIPNEFVADRWGIRSAAVKNSVEFFTPRDKSDRIFHTCEESVPWEIRFNKAIVKMFWSITHLISLVLNLWYLDTAVTLPVRLSVRPSVIFLSLRGVTNKHYLLTFV